MVWQQLRPHTVAFGRIQWPRSCSSTAPHGHRPCRLWPWKRQTLLNHEVMEFKANMHTAHMTWFFSPIDSVVVLGLVFALGSALLGDPPWVLMIRMRNGELTSLVFVRIWSHMSLCKGRTPPDYTAFKGSVHEHVASAVDDKGPWAHGVETVLAENLFKSQRCLDLKVPK